MTLVSAPTPGDRSESRVPHVEFVGVDKSYDGRNLVVRGLDLTVERGEFLTLLGAVRLRQDDLPDDARRI